MTAVSMADYHRNIQGLTKSRPVSFFHVLKGSYLKEVRITLRYRANLIANQIQSLLFIGSFALMASAFVFNLDVELSFRETMVFFIGGLLIVFYDGVALWKPINSINRDLYNGTLEYLFFNPHSRIAYFVGNILSSATFASVFSIPLVIALVVVSGIDFFTLIWILLAAFMTVSVLVAFGVMISLLAIKYKRVNGLVGTIGTLFTFLSGFLFPITFLPPYIRIASYLLPYTYGIDLVRHFSLGDKWTTLLPVPMLWGVLATYMVIYWLIAAFLLRKVEASAKKDGLNII